MSHAELPSLRTAHLPGAVYVFAVDPAGVPDFLFVSDTCADIYGFTAAEAMADAQLMHDAVHPQDRADFDRASEESLRTLGLLHWEGRVVGADGVPRRVLITSQPRQQVDGSILWHGVVVDRSGVRDELAERHEVLAERDELRADLLGMLGHDLAAPLSAILGHAEQGLDVLDAPQADGGADALLLRRCLHAVMRNARRLDALQQDLLATAADGAGRMRATPRAVPLRPGLLGAASGVGREGRDVSVECPVDLVCRVQPSHLDQIVSNLVSNADKYARARITLSARGRADQVVLEVTDDGPGVPPDFVDQLFHRYRRASNADDHAAGTGLGLFIVRTLAELNHGSASYQPGPGGGARFTVTLPAAVP